MHSSRTSNLRTRSDLQRISSEQAQSINGDRISSIQDVRANINHVLYLLKFYRAPLETVTNDPETLREANELLNLIEEIELALYVITNTVYLNLTHDPGTEIERSSQNIDTLKKNIRNAIARITRVTDSMPPLAMGSVRELPTPPEAQLESYENPKTLSKILEAMREYLRSFIFANKVHLLANLKATSSDLNTAIDDLSDLDEESQVELGNDSTLSDKLDTSWTNTLRQLSLRLAHFETQAKEIYRPNAEQLILQTDEAALNRALEQENEAIAKLQTKVNLKYGAAALPPVALFLKIYEHITGESTASLVLQDERQIADISDKVQIYSTTLGRRKQLTERRSR